MQSELIRSISEKAESLSPEDQKKAIEYIEKLAKRRNAPRLKLFERIDQIVSERKPEIWDEVPTDSSLNVDHYLYGTLL